MRILRAADHPRMPWRNGGGETREILAHPPGADTASFDWRISMARVEVDGPFSVFDGVDRVLAVLEGGGLELTIEGMGTHLLAPSSDPLAFPADAATTARLAGGPIADLNVMVRRGRFAAAVERMAGAVALPASVHPTILLALGPLDVEAGADRLRLEREDALLTEGRSLSVAGEAGFYCIALVPAAAAT